MSRGVSTKMDYKLLVNSSIEALNGFDPREQGVKEYIEDFLGSRWKVSNSSVVRAEIISNNKMHRTNYSEC